MLPIFEYVNIFVLFFIYWIRDATSSTLNSIMGEDDFLRLMENAGQGPRKIDNWGGTYSYIRVVHH